MRLDIITANEKQILSNFGIAVPKMSAADKEILLAFGAGIMAAQSLYEQRTVNDRRLQIPCQDDKTT